VEWKSRPQRLRNSDLIEVRKRARIQCRLEVETNLALYNYTNAHTLEQSPSERNMVDI